MSFSSLPANEPETARMGLALKFSQDRQPVALQWDVSYPSPKVGLEEKDLLISAEAKAAGKVLACRGSAKDAGTYVYRCILAGGSRPVPSGILSLLTFRIRSYARPGPIAIRLSNAQGVTANGRGIEIAGGVTEIR